MNSVLMSENVHDPRVSGIPMGITLADYTSSYLSSAVTFCLTTDVHEKLGLNLLDIMELPVPLFHKIQELMVKHRPVESNELQKLLRDYDRKR